MPPLSLSLKTTLIPSARMSRVISYANGVRNVASPLRRSSLHPFARPLFRQLSNRRNTDHNEPSAATNKAESLASRIWSSLDQLGATRNVKIAIIVALSIFSTMETIFYVKAAMRYFSPPKDESKCLD